MTSVRAASRALSGAMTLRTLRGNVREFARPVSRKQSLPRLVKTREQAPTVQRVLAAVASGKPADGSNASTAREPESAPVPPAILPLLVPRAGFDPSALIQCRVTNIVLLVRRRPSPGCVCRRRLSEDRYVHLSELTPDQPVSVNSSWAAPKFREVAFAILREAARPSLWPSSPHQHTDPLRTR
jgi:hypothetical protein